MSALSIQPPFPIFTESDGLPLENGYIWIGAAFLPPQTNPIQVYWDAALTVQATQPIRTLGGYPSRNGTPARLYVNAPYSILVQNKNGSTIYSTQDSPDRYSSDMISIVGFNGQTGTVADLTQNDGADWIGYQPPGAGIARTAQEKMRDIVSVKDFGAVGDGVADDTSAIQSAINASANVLLPPGTYKITKLSIINKTDFLLIGYGARIEFTGAPVNGTHALAIIQSSNICIAGLVIDGNNETRGALEGSHNVSIYGCVNVIIEDVKSIYSSSDGFYVNRSAVGPTINGYALTTLIQTENVTLRNCIAEYNCRQGLSGISYIGLTAINCRFSKTGKSSAGFIAPAAGIDLEPNQPSVYLPQRSMFLDCTFYDNNGSHLIINARSSDTIVDGCTLDTGTSYGIAQSGARSYIRNTVIKNTGATSRPSINIASQSPYERASCIIENVLIEGAIQGGITVASYADTVIRNVTVRDGANYGIRFVSGSDPGDGNLGYCTIQNVSIERLYENNPPSGISYVGGTFGGLLKVTNLRCVRTGATGTPIERGIDFSSAGIVNLQTLTDVDVIGAFAVYAAQGFTKAKTLQNNRLNGTVSNALNLIGSATYDPPNLADGDGATTVVTVTGAALGDIVQASFSLDLQGILLTAWVSAIDTVNVRFQNETGGAIDLGSGTLLAQVRKV